MRRLFLSVCILFISTGFCLSQTNINGGDISGLWEQAKSPYLISGDVSIPYGQLLTIEKGVRVEFQGSYKFNIKGRLLAIGTKQDSIIFTSKDSITKWKGIRFDDFLATDSSKMVYCVVENGFASSGLTFGISNDDFGGGIYMHGNTLLLSNSTIRNNKAYSGGGINSSGQLKIINTKIINNSAEDGGGLVISECIKTEIIGCIISNNIAKRHAALVAMIGDILFLNNTICNNVTSYEGYSSIYLGGDSKFVNTIIYYNKPSWINIANTFNPQFINCDLEDGIESLRDAHPNEKGVFDGIYKDNIDDLPRFVKREKGDYQLSLSSCINSGTTSSWCSVYNVDIVGNPRVYNDSKRRVDIGAIEYQGATPNRAPYIQKMSDLYILKSQDYKLTLKYYDADVEDIQSAKVTTSDSHVIADILNVNDSSIVMNIKPDKFWIGDCYLYIDIDDNSNTVNAVCHDSVRVFISNKFKGLVTADMMFQDTVEVIGNITVAESGRLVIKPGTHVKFMDYYGIKVYGKINAIGTELNKINFYSTKSVVSRVGNDWAGIELYGINNNDTTFFSNCIVKDAGLRNTPIIVGNGMISIENSKNIYFTDCFFDCDLITLTNKDNRGIYVSNSQNLLFKNCTFLKYRKDDGIGACMFISSSNVTIDGCNFSDNNSIGPRGQLSVESTNSTVRILNTHFFNSFGGINGNYSNLSIENCMFENNEGVVYTSACEVLIRNNKIINNIGRAISASGGRLIVTGNLISNNTLSCNCSNFYGVAIEVDGINSKSIIANNTIVNNKQDSNGGTVYYAYCSPTIVNNIIWNNNRGGVSGYNGAGIGIPNPIVKNNLIEGGYYDKTFMNYDFDPLFDLNITENYTLLNTSPCINKGLSDTTGLFLPEYDLLGHKRIDKFYNKLDLGAYEYAGDDVPTGVTQLSLNGINVYPNPTNSKLFLDLEFNTSEFLILNMNGQIVKSGIISNNCIDVSDLNCHTYLLRIRKNNRYFEKIFIKL